MKPQVKKQLEILKDTVEFYHLTKNRAMGEQACQYRMKGEDGQEKKCAVGRYLNKKQLDLVMKKGSGSVGSAFEDLHNEGLLKSYDQLKNQPLDFWDDLQELHDQSDLHNKCRGYTTKGKARIKAIENKIKLEVYV